MLRFSRDGAVGLVEPSHPKVKSRLTEELLGVLSAVSGGVRSDDGVRAVVPAGSGFCARPSRTEFEKPRSGPGLGERAAVGIRADLRSWSSARPHPPQGRRLHV